uniref:Uncharacterized protein n=1 Tax=viral metagenome TaxID=1070528 RepID=A0A6C0IZF1_9ZZZZ
MDNLLFVESGPCKLLRVATSTYLYIEHNKNKDRELNNVAIEVCTDDIAYDEALDERTHKRKHDFIFSAFSLVSDGFGAYQLRYVPIPLPRMTVDEALVTQARQDLVLGMLPHENGVAGLVPRLSNQHPTLGSQVIIRREGMQPYANVCIENSFGLLHYNSNSQRYEFGAINQADVERKACFHFEKIVDMSNVNVSVPLMFVRYPLEPSILVLPPPETTASFFEETYADEISKRKRVAVLRRIIRTPPPPVTTVEENHTRNSAVFFIVFGAAIFYVILRYKHSH